MSNEKMKINAGHKNVDTSEEKKAAASARIDKRITILNDIVREREATLTSMEGLPTKLTEFTNNDWVAADIDLKSIKFTRGTYYQKWNKEKFETRLTKLFEQIKNPKRMNDEVKILNDQINDLRLINQNLMEANHKLDRKLSREVALLKNQLKASLAANKRLHEQLQRKADVVIFKPKGN